MLQNLQAGLSGNITSFEGLPQPTTAHQYVPTEHVAHSRLMKETMDPSASFKPWPHEFRFFTAFHAIFGHFTVFLWHCFFFFDRILKSLHNFVAVLRIEAKPYKVLQLINHSGNLFRHLRFRSRSRHKQSQEASNTF